MGDSKMSGIKNSVYSQEIITRETCQNCGGMGEVWMLKGLTKHQELARCTACNGAGVVDEKEKRVLAGLETRNALNKLETQ